MRALFEIALRKRWPAMTYRLLNLCKVIDKRLWGWAHPLRQFAMLPPTVLSRLEDKNLTVDKLKDMRKDEIGKWAHWFCTIWVHLGILHTFFSSVLNPTFVSSKDALGHRCSWRSDPSFI